MELDIHTLDGGNLNIEDFEAADLMDLLDGIREGKLLEFTLNDGMAYIPAASVARVDATD